MGRQVVSCNGGFVRLVEQHGTELTVVNAARVSYEKESNEFDMGDRRLLSFLAREGHWSPFRHAGLALEFRQPLMVARQHWRYVVGGGHIEEGQVWNEASRRYVQEPAEFYQPEAWRYAPANSKQGSGGTMPIEDALGLNDALEQYQSAGETLYREALERGVAPELARLFLPAYGMLVRYRWTPSWDGLRHFWAQRLADDAQLEIQRVAQAVKTLALEANPRLAQTVLEHV